MSESTLQLHPDPYLLEFLHHCYQEQVLQHWIRTDRHQKSLRLTDTKGPHHCDSFSVNLRRNMNISDNPIPFYFDPDLLFFFLYTSDPPIRQFSPRSPLAKIEETNSPRSFASSGPLMKARCAEPLLNCHCE